MAEYRISGIWKDSNNVITHYAVHLRTRNANNDGCVIGYAVKMTKTATITLLQNQQNSAKTYLWNYITANWHAEADIHVVNENPPFLRTTHDGIVKNNLLHLIDYGYVYY
jgi:hypothetical protein